MNVIAVDLGGTNTRLACAKSLDEPIFTEQPTRRRNTHDYDNDFNFLIETAKKLSYGKPIDALGIGVPGRVNDNKSDMVASNNMPEWANRDFCSELSKALNCPVYMDNDGVAAGLGEGYFGSLQGDVHYLIWGTGISSVYVKHTGKGVEATYARPDYKAHFDAWEDACGGAAIMRKYGKPGEELTEQEWGDINKQFAHYLQKYIELAKPAAIMFGGGLAIHHAATIASHANEMGVTIRITQFGDNNGLIGGLGLIKRGVTSAKPS